MAVAERPNATNSPPVPCQLPTTILSTLGKCHDELLAAVCIRCKSHFQSIKQSQTCLPDLAQHRMQITGATQDVGSQLSLQACLPSRTAENKCVSIFTSEPASHWSVPHESDLKLLHLPASHCRTRRHQGSIHRLRHPATASLWQRRLPTLDR